MGIRLEKINLIRMHFCRGRLTGKLSEDKGI